MSQAMVRSLTASVFSCLALCACGPEPQPEAAPGAVERTTKALDRQEATERSETIDRNDREAKARADAAARRIRAVEKTGSNANQGR